MKLEIMNAKMEFRSIKYLALIAVLSSTISTPPVSCVEIEDIDFKIYDTKGFKVSVAHREGITVTDFYATLNKPIDIFGDGELSSHKFSRSGYKWIFEDKTTKINTGDKINYYISFYDDSRTCRLTSVHEVLDEEQDENLSRRADAQFSLSCVA